MALILALSACSGTMNGVTRGTGEAVTFSYEQGMDSDTLTAAISGETFRGKAVMRGAPLFLKNVALRVVYASVGESKGCLNVSNLGRVELPEAMKRKRHKDSKPREHKKGYGKDIAQRPEIAALRIEEGHWEGDTVVGKRAGKEAVVLSLLEKKTENYIAIQIPGKDADSVLNAMQSLREEFGDKFSQVFKTITVDNGSEFSTFSLVENWGSAVYFAHPYTSWERPQNERHNGLFRAFVPKGASIESFSPEYILSAADELNGRPRKKLGYRTPEELFDEFLDSVYAASGCGSIAQNGSQRLPS